MRSELRQYLLGVLGEERRLRLEERLFTDEELFEELAVAEEELIDQYLAGTLSETERGDFQTRFLLTPERRRKLRFAATFRRYIAGSGARIEAGPESPPSGEPVREEPREQPRPPRRRWRLPAWLGTWPALPVAAALLLVALTSLSLVFDPFGWRRQQPGRVLMVALTPGLVRGGEGPNRVNLSPGTDTVRLRLRLPADEYESYRATLQTAEGGAVHAEDGLKSAPEEGGRAVSLDLPAAKLPPGVYRLRLDATAPSEPVASYTFRVADR